MAPHPLRRLRSRSLRAQLQLMMLSLLVLSIGSLFVLHLFSERALLARVRDYTEELSTAIEITQEQPGGGTDLQKAVTAYAEKLREARGEGRLDRRRLRGGGPGLDRSPHRRPEADEAPRAVGVRHPRRARGRLRPGPPVTSNLTIPIVVGDRRVGYVVITRILDDFSVLSETALASRVAATLAVFALGMLLSLFLASAVSRPVQALTDAARRVAAGDLSARVRASGSDEVGALARTFNQMVERLAESRVLEERLRVAERSTAMGRFASALAHEIRNPLNSISLTIDHVRTRLGPEDEARPPEFQSLMTTLKSELARLNRLVGDFLSSGQPARLDPRPCDVGAVVRETAALVQHKAREQAIEVEVDAAAGLPRDPRRPRAAQDLRPQPRPQRLRGHARRAAGSPSRSRLEGPPGRARRSPSSCPTPGWGCPRKRRPARSSPTSRRRRPGSASASPS